MSFTFFLRKKLESVEEGTLTSYQKLIVAMIWTLFTLNLMHAVSAQIFGFLEFVHTISDTYTYQTLSMIQLEILIPSKDCLTLMGLTYMFSF